MMILRCTIVVCLLALLAACATAPAPAPVEKRAPVPAVEPVDTQPVPDPVDPAPRVTDEPAPVSDPQVVEPLPPATTEDTAPTVSPAVIALLETAREQAAAGDDEQAAASLERALRIEPDNPWLWHRLGVLRLQQERYREALELATRSNSFAQGNRRLQAGNWELIARAQEALGDMTAADRARRSARDLLGDTAGPIR